MSLQGPDFGVAGPRSSYDLVQTKVGQLFLRSQFTLFTDLQDELSSSSQSYGGRGRAQILLVRTRLNIVTRTFRIAQGAPSPGDSQWLASFGEASISVIFACVRGREK
jgi:hypothetical protein